MNKIWRELVLAACIAGFIYLMVFAIVPCGLHTDKSYSGQEISLAVLGFAIIGIPSIFLYR